MSQPPNPTLTIYLTLSQVNTTLQHLQQGVYASVTPIINSITEQAERQLDEIRARQASDAKQASLPDVEPASDVN
jgi:hypothetical protein